MNRQEINRTIIKYLDQYYPARIGIFGSFAREEDTPESDIDILVKFKNTISLFELVKIERELTSILGKKVDLVTEPALKNKKLKKYIYKDLQIIFE
jgi:predicted nucleotidyltransferase